MSEEVLVTVSCTAYNHENFIRDALDGFVMQETNFRFEVIVHDDASTDRTAEIIKEYELRYPNIIKPIYQKENQWSKGIKPSANFIWPKIKSKYIALCEGDDYWTDPDKLQKQVDFLEANPEYSLTYHSSVNKFEGIDLTKKTILKEPYDVPLQNSRTLTLLFRNLLKDLPSSFNDAPNGDQFLKYFLRKNGKFKFLTDIKPSVRRVHEGGVMSLKSKNDQFDRKYKTWMTIYKEFGDKSLKGTIDRLSYLKYYYEFQSISIGAKFIRLVPLILRGLISGHYFFVVKKKILSLLRKVFKQSNLVRYQIVHI